MPSRIGCEKTECWRRHSFGQAQSQGRHATESSGWLGDSLKVKLKAPPEQGRTNEAVVALLAEPLEIDASSIAMMSGHSSPATVVEVNGIVVEAIRAAFPSKKPRGKRWHEDPRISELPVQETHPFPAAHSAAHSAGLHLFQSRTDFVVALGDAAKNTASKRGYPLSWSEQ